MNLKRPHTLNEQIERLKAHRLNVVDTDEAKQILSQVNYYRLTGYGLQYRDSNTPDNYIPGTSFDDIWQIHQFDAELRCLLKQYLDMVEIYARSQIAYGFSLSKCVTPPHDQHYDEENFYNKKSYNEIITSGLDKEKKHSRDALFVIHHAEKYGGRMPLWVIVELLSFTNLSKLYSAMYFAEQDIIAKNMGSTRNVIKNNLHCLANLRNVVAHAGRLYNTKFNPPVILGRRYLQRNPDIKTDTLFSYLVALMRRIPNKDDRVVFIENLNRLVNKFAGKIQLKYLGFPHDYSNRSSLGLLSTVWQI